MKKLFSILLILTILSPLTVRAFCIQTKNTQFFKEVDIPYNLTDNYVEEKREFVTNSVLTYSSNTKTYSIDWTVEPNQTLMGSTRTLMVTGNTVTFNLSYTPSTANVEIGMLSPVNTFIRYIPTNGSLSSTMVVPVDGIYRIRIKNNSNYTITVTGTYTVPITYGNKWYSQLNSDVGTTWNSDNLNNLYFPNMASCSDCDSVYKCANTPLYTTSTFSPQDNQLRRGHINNWGCTICSMAMVLKNMGATTSNKYDFRTETTGKLNADPFTVTMANISWLEISNVSNSRYEITSYTSSNTPEYVYWDRIASSFGKTAYRVDFTNMTAQEKADLLSYYVKANPEGVIVRANWHTVVITQTTHENNLLNVSNTTNYPTPIKITSENEELIAQEEYALTQNITTSKAVSSTEFDSKFICYDPGTTLESRGNGVTYNNSYAGTTIGGIDTITYVYYLD